MSIIDNIRGALSGKWLGGAGTATDVMEKVAKEITSALANRGYIQMDNPGATNLSVLVCRTGDLLPVWVGANFDRILNERLQENMINFRKVSSTVVESKPEGAGIICLREGELYLRIGSSHGKEGGATGQGLLLCLHAGTGSSNRAVHELDPRVALEYALGRGVSGEPEADATRIIIRDDEPDGELADRNSHVSRKQGSIYFDEASHTWWLVRRPGSSSLRYSVAGEIPSQIYPLAEGDRMELEPGASIFLGSRGVRFDIKEACGNK